MRHSKKDAIRLNKLISESGFCSRREADLYIEQERVTVNSHTAMPGDKVYRTDFIRIDGEPLRFIEKPVFEKRKPEFASKRISRNTDKPKLAKPKPEKAKEIEKEKTLTAKPDKATNAKGGKPDETKSKVGEAKKWFSGRKRR